MDLKTVEIDGKTYAEVQDGKPIYIDGGKEVAFDAPGTKATISRLNGEAQGHRTAKEEALEALKAFEGIADPAAAVAALETVANLDAKKLVEAGDMDAAIAAAVKPFQEKLTAAEQERDSLKTSLSKEMIGNEFSRSKWVSENLTPAGTDLVRQLYADRMHVEDGKTVFMDRNGQKMFSEGRPGEMASFDEAIQSFVSEYAHKDHILKGRQQSGSGAQPGAGGAQGDKTIARQVFNDMPQHERAAKMKDGFKVVDA